VVGVGRVGLLVQRQPDPTQARPTKGISRSLLAPLASWLAGWQSMPKTFQINVLITSIFHIVKILLKLNY
jgi:hypothetical protein